jgi:2-methylcitrate dehydratase PrpD
MASDYLDKLAEFVTSTRLEDLNNSTIMAAKTVVLDTLGAPDDGQLVPRKIDPVVLWRPAF